MFPYIVIGLLLVLITLTSLSYRNTLILRQALPTKRIFSDTNTDLISTCALRLVKDMQLINGVSGEYKRHRVYAKLIKLFPEARRCDLGLLIENIVQELNASN